jgi:hypothetical protein
MPTCQQCSFFALIDGHPAGAGICCCEPPKPFPAMGNPGPLVMAKPQAQPVTIGLDPPVAADRKACRHFRRDLELN